MSHRHVIELTDVHAGGDISRIVTGGVGTIPGTNVRAQMEYLRDRADGLRRLLLEEPHGRPDMSVDLIVPAADPAAQAGYVIMEVMGYPIYSGSNTICTATALLETGRVAKREGRQQFVLESPAGAVDIAAEIRNDVVESITCEGLPSYVETPDARVTVPGVGTVHYSVVYSGGFYAVVDAEALGFDLVPAERDPLAETAHAIVTAIRADSAPRHYRLGDVGPLPFVHFAGPVSQIGGGRYRARSATYVHPGVICRSTTGTGTSARLALMHRDGRLTPGDVLETVSIGGSVFSGCLTGVTYEAERALVANTISGRGYVTARSQLVFDPDDSLIAPNMRDLPRAPDTP
ncbi:proline racemase [Salinisphaera sp. USBA-960]|nr:proline racemase [Salifodinibacter halophilus]NNC27104.1 proline racemase [Salifodinibacter halophilus]